MNERNDLFFSSEGDYAIDENRKDLLDTSLLKLRNRVQQASTRIQSNKGDWRHQPSVGADLGDFFGASNTQEVGNKLRTRILNELTKEGLFSPGEVQIEVVPLSKTELACMVWVTPSGETSSIFLNYLMNLSSNMLIPRSN